MSVSKRMMSLLEGFKPPASVAKEAEKGLELRKKAGGKGGLTKKEASKQGIGSGVQRAVNLKNRDELSKDTIKRMKAFFDRHEKNKSIGAGKEPHEDKGYVAWKLWGGDAGRAWANKMVNKFEEAAPPQLKRCVAKVAGKGKELDSAFAICVSSLQKSGQLGKGSLALTKKGEKVAKSKSSEKGHSKIVSKYKSLLKNK